MLCGPNWYTLGNRIVDRSFRTKEKGVLGNGVTIGPSCPGCSPIVSVLY